MPTLKEYALATPLTWPDAELWSGRLLDAVARRHAEGKGGPCTPGVAAIFGETLILPEGERAGSDSAVASAAGQALFEFLTGLDLGEFPGDWRSALLLRWPNVSEEHVALLEAAMGPTPPPPAVNAREWADLRQRSATLKPLRLNKMVGRSAVTTGLIPPLPGTTGDIPPIRNLAAPSILDEPVEDGPSILPWVVVAGLVGLVIVAVIAAVLGAFS